MNVSTNRPRSGRGSLGTAEHNLRTIGLMHCLTDNDRVPTAALSGNVSLLVLLLFTEKKVCIHWYSTVY